MNPVASARSLAICCASTLFAGCNLSEPASSFEYQGEFIVISFDQGNGEDQDEDAAPPPDMGPPGDPELVITELLIHSNDVRPGAGERGEYIEIRNVGDGPANPRSVALVLIDPNDEDALPERIQIAPPLTSEEVQVVSNLLPIQPGDYFVFVRHEVLSSPVGDEGRSYDYGRFTNGPSLINDSPRLVELRYVDGADIATHDVVRFGDGEIQALDGEGPGLAYEVNTSVSVREDSEDPESNDEPSNWCLSDTFFDEGTFRGNPGEPADCGG